MAVAVVVLGAVGPHVALKSQQLHSFIQKNFTSLPHRRCVASIDGIRGLVCWLVRLVSGGWAELNVEVPMPLKISHARLAVAVHRRSFHIGYLCVLSADTEKRRAKPLGRMKIMRQCWLNAQQRKT